MKKIIPAITWEHTYGGNRYDEANSLIQTTDGGYAVAGFTDSKGAGSEDFWIIKLDKEGNQLWDQTYGGNSYDDANSLIQTTDGGYAVAGFTNSKGAGSEDFWIIKLDKEGNQLWDHTYGGNSYDEANSLIQTTDGGYAVAGFTDSKGAGSEDFWIIKLDKEGNQLWDQTYGGTRNDEANSLIQTTDGGYAVAGFTDSKGAGNRDFWIIKLDKEGNQLWDQTYGGTRNDEANSLIQTTDGGYAVAGFTNSKGAGSEDFWIIKLDKEGNQLWDQTYGGTRNDEANSLIQTTDGGYAIAGITISTGSGNRNFWVIKLDKEGNQNWDQTYGGKDWEEANSLIQTTDGGCAVAGFTAYEERSTGSINQDLWIIKLIHESGS